MKHGKRLVALFISLSLIANHTSTVIALGDEYKRLFIEQSLNAPNITWDTKNEVIVGTAFDSMKGVKAIDDKGNDITDKVKVTGSVDTSKEGEYVLTYSIVDSEEEPITRVVRVIPNPEFNVSGSDYVRTYKGEEFDYKQGLTITDSKGNDITSSVTCEGNVDINKLGSYNLKYYVPDKKEPILERTVDVIEKNVFNVYLNNEKLQKSLENYNNWLKDPNKDPNKPVSIEKDLAFSIYLDNKTSKFALENQSSEKLDVSIGDEVFANIKVFDKDNNEKLSIELLGSDTGNSEKLDKLKELTYEYGDYISIVTKDSKNCLDITGTLTGDIDNTKEDCKEYYSDGVDNLDYIKNVRFNIVKEGIKTVYNNAPEIRINGELTIEDIKNNDLLKYISIIDDRDAYIGLDEVSVSVEDISDQQKVVTYQVSDDWGRTTIKKVIVVGDISKENRPSTLNLQTLTEENPSIQQNKIIVGGIALAGQSDFKRLEIGFNPVNRTITIPFQDGKVMNSRFEDNPYFRFTVYDRDGKEKISVTLNGRDRSNSDKLRPLRGFRYKPTDFISIWHAEAGEKLTIAGTNITTNGSITSDGSVNFTSAQTVDFTSGTTVKEWESIRFKLLDTGLVAYKNEAPIITITTSPTTLRVKRGGNVDLRKDIEVYDTLESIPKENVIIEGFDNLKEGNQVITYSVADSWGTTGSTTRAVIVEPKNDIDDADIDFKDKDGNKVFSLAFDELKKEFTLKYKSTQHSIEPGSNDEVLTIKVFNKYGKARKTFRIYGKDLGNSANINALNGFKYSEGEYIQIVAKYPERIKVDANVTKEKEYSNVTTSPSTLANVRFQLGKKATDNNNDKVGKFIAVYNEAPVINVTSETTIKRGEEFSPLKGVIVNDDHDEVETAITTNKVIVSYRNYTTDETAKFIKYDDSITKKEGKYQILYKVKDSWGREGQQIAILNVNDKTELENNSIELLVNDKPMITIGFDELEHKLKVLDFNERLFLDGNNADNMFEMLIYNSTPGTTQTSPQTIQIKYGQNLTKEDVQKINDISYSNTSFISFRVYDKSKLRIKGNIVSPENKRDAVKIATDGVNQETETYNNGFSSDDVIHNTYFKLSSDGLDDVYNNAPVFNGVTRATIIVGSDFDELNGVTVTDDHDVSITTSKIVVTGDNVTTKSSIGVYTVTYQVTDSMGRSTMVTRQVEVLPNYSTNTIEFYDGNTQKYRIGLNKYATGFEVLSTGATVTQTKTTNTTEYSIKVFDTNGYEINSIDLTGDYTTDQSELDELKKIQLKYGYRFSVWSEEVSKVKILGTVDKGNYAEIQNVNYNNITTRDSIDNVRFEITQDKTKAIYNKAPVLTVPQTPFEMYKGEIVDLTSGATITDDHDNGKLTNSDIEVEGDFTQVGTTTATFTVRDTWGRISNTTTRQVHVKDGIARNEIILSAGRRIKNGENNNGNGYMSEPVIKIKFNTTTGDIEAERIGTYGNANGEDFLETAGHYNTLITIKLYSSSSTAGSILQQVVINAASSIEDIKDSINNLNAGYGDWINMSFTHNKLVTIKGQVVNAKQVYDPYVEISSDLEKTYFKITENGLEAQVETENMSDNISLIEWYEPFAGSLAVQIEIDTSNNTIKTKNIPGLSPGVLIDHYKRAQYLVKFNINDLFIRGLKGENSGYSYFPSRENDIDTQFNRKDYITITELEDSRKNNLRIKNYHIATGQTVVEDYSDGIDNLEEIKYTRFYNTDNGLTVYNDAPAIFTGADDIDIIVNTTFSVLDGVSAKNCIPVDRDINVTTSDNLIVSASPQTIDTSRVGRNVITYTVKDSWGRTTTKERVVNVRPKLFNNRFEVFSSNNLTTPAFTIGFDNYTSKYTVEANSDDYIDESLGNQSAFKLWVIGSDGTKRAELDILGTDTAYSSEFNKLKNLNYQDGDYIKVWRNPKGSSGSTISTIKIQGEIRGQKEDYRDGIDNIDYMNNVVFKVSETNGLESIYNAAPEIHGAGDIIIKKGTPFNTTSGVTATDDRNNDGTTNVTINKIDISGDKVNSDRTGMYKVIYTVTDSWGRTTSKTRTVIVISNVVDNMFKVYKNSATNSGNEELAFTFGFGVISNKLRVYYPGLTIQESMGVKTTPPNTTASITTGVTITIYDRFGERLANVLLDGNNDKNDLLSLNNFEFKNNYMIAVQYHNNPSKVKIDGKVINATDETIDTSYKNGFNNEDEMNSVRFKITDDGLKEVKQQALTFTGLTELKITRGDKDADLLNGVGIDGLSEELNKEKVVIKGLDEFKIGTQKVTYSYIDSWGTTVTSQRTIIVEPRNDLEAIEIKTSDDKNPKEDLFTIRMDTIENNFYLDFVTKPTAFTTEDSVKLNTIEVFDGDGNSKGRFEISYGDLKDDNKIQELSTRVNQIGFEYGDSIYIKSYDPKDGFKIIGNTTGDITTSEELYSDGVDDIDHIENVRFKLTEDGLYTMYNHAPEFTEFNKTVSVFRSEEFDPTVGVKITDKEDGDIDPSLVVLDKVINTDTISVQKVTYTIADSWGRTTSTERTVVIRSQLDNNVIEIREGDKNSTTLFTINFDSETNEMTINKNITISNTSANTILTIYNSTGSTVSTITLNGNKGTITKRDVNSKRAKNIRSGQILKNQYEYGYYLSINAENASGVTIKGDIQQDERIKENYSDGIDNIDYMNNVRFRFNELGLEAIYNSAPIININNLINGNTSKTTLVLDKDFNNQYDLLQGITLSDDHDDLTTKDIIVTTNSSMGTLGKHTIRYEVIDSWGRSSEIAERTIEIINALQRNSIMFQRIGKTDYSYEEGVQSTTSFVITFDVNDKTLDVNVVDRNKFVDTGSVVDTYIMKLKTSQGSIKYEKILRTNDTPDSAHVDEIGNFRFEYGDRLNFYKSVPKGIFINGKVKGGKEDYSDGADIGDYLTDTDFIITESGLVADYKPSYKDGNGYTNSISYNLGFSGSLGFRIKYNPTEKRLIATERDTQDEYLDTKFNENVFGIKMCSSDGTLKTYTNTSPVSSQHTQAGATETFNGNETFGGRNTRPQKILNKFNNMPIEYGDYMEITLYRRAKNFNITGYIQTTASQVFEDFSDGIDEDPDDFKYIRFYFTPTGLLAYENQAPVVHGATDLNIIKGEPFDLSSGITVTDDIDRPEDIRFTSGESAFIEACNQVGLHQVDYTATDTWGRSSVVSRFVFVTARPEIHVDTTKLTVEVGSIPISDSEYIKSIVTVTDEEDDEDPEGRGDIREKLKIDDKDHFDSTKPGSYEVTYSVTDSDNNTATTTVTIEVVRTINVSVPISIPFQIVTNLITTDGTTTTPDPFVAGKVKISNNQTSDLDIFVEKVERKEDASTRSADKQLKLVSPTSVTWENLSPEQSMEQMALGIYYTSSSNSTLSTAYDRKENPLWLVETGEQGATNDVKLGTLKRRATTTSASTEAVFTFTSKHGPKFQGGTSRGKFDLVFRFE